MKRKWDHAPFWVAPVGACRPQENLLLWAAVLPTRNKVNTVIFFLALGSSFLCSGLEAASCLGGSGWGWLVGWAQPCQQHLTYM